MNFVIGAKYAEIVTIQAVENEVDHLVGGHRHEGVQVERTGAATADPRDGDGVAAFYGLAELTRQHAGAG